MDSQQAKVLGQRLRARRKELGLSQRRLQDLTNVDNATIARLERGVFVSPAPAKLARIADALAMSLADVFALANYVVPSDLPTFEPYLRARYRDMPTALINELQQAFVRITLEHGYDSSTKEQKGQVANGA